MKIFQKDRWLAVTFERPQTALSWAVCGGGLRQVNQVVWHQVQNEDLPPALDPQKFLEQAMAQHGFEHAAGMLTRVDVSLYRHSSRSREGIEVQCVATAGMTNALRIGDAPALLERAGTINLLCAVPVPLSLSAMIEAMSLAVEARTAAVLDSNFASIQSGLPATGTGTDCVVLVCPEAGTGAENYAGKHTLLGSLTGETVYSAVEAALARWKEQQP